MSWPFFGSFDFSLIFVSLHLVVYKPSDGFRFWMKITHNFRAMIMNHCLSAEGRKRHLILVALLFVCFD